MDLVDIDQVLDNLELREAADEQNKAAQRFQLRTQQQAASLPPPPEAHCNGLTAIAPSLAGVGAVAGGSKSFIGVSQVFNSLDDYRKNVESLEAASTQQYDEECRLITEHSSLDETDYAGRAITPSLRKKVVTPPQRPPPANKYKIHGSMAADDDGDDDDDDDDDEDDTDEDDDDEDEASNDIHKFTESPPANLLKVIHPSDDLMNTPSSDSITTSSSSTFSSGPSPGLASTSEEPVTPLDGVVNHALEEDDDVDEGVDEGVGDEGVDDTDGEMEDMAQAQLRLSSLASNAVKQNNQTNESREISEAAAQPVAVLDELAQGLSTISINTADIKSNLDEATAAATTTTTSMSSELQNVLAALSETVASTAQLNDSRVAEGVNVLESKSYPDADKPQEPQNSEPSTLETADLPMDNNKVVVANATIEAHEAQFPLPLLQQQEVQTQQQQQQQQQQPLTFCSTMDEISDAELDSMLQEMDVDEVAEVEEHVSKLSLTETVETLPVLDKAEETAAVVPTTPTLPVNIPSVSGQEDLSLNADSLSQASTVEFSEIRQHGTPPPPPVATVVDTPSAPQVENSIASSYTSDESSLDECAGANGEMLAGADGGAGERRPQRPTTLDVPTMKINMYANAGQTPPPVGEAIMGDASQATAQFQNESMDNGTVDSGIAEATGHTDPNANLGRVPPVWVPDNMAASCMQCHTKFTMIKRRHHCRACGKLLCSVCCSQKFKLEFLNDPESRVCVQCYLILTRRQQPMPTAPAEYTDEDGAVGSSVAVTPTRSPNPNNPLEYCSTIPPHRQVSATAVQPPTVIVPVGVLKKEGSSSPNSNGSKKGRKRKSVMFSDGIAPGSDLASMEHQWSEAKHARRGQQQGDKSRGSSGGGAGNKPSTPVRTESRIDAAAMGLVAQLFRGSIPPSAAAAAVSMAEGREETSAAVIAANRKQQTPPQRAKRLPPSGCDERGCFLPKEGASTLPPIVVKKDDNSFEYDFKEVANCFELIERLQRETLRFAVQKNLFVDVKIANLKCCMNRTVINFTTYGMHHVGNDELIILLEFEIPASKDQMAEPPIPKDIFVHLYEIYCEAEAGNPIAELSYTSPQQSNFLGSREYGGFIFIRSTFQCLQEVIVPENPYLIGILIHRHEVPWAKVFPLRLMLRLGAQYRYYPCPHISIRNRESVYAEIAQTIINFLADFRNYSYTLPCIRGMYIHMEDRQTTVLIPRNRLDDVIKAINNSSDHILAFGGNFSKTADGHLVCMQNVNDDRTEMYSYSTQAINIQGQPRKVTGASFFVLNEALKSTSGLSGKCSIVEDGLMVQIMPVQMEKVRNALRNQTDIDIKCGPINADEQHTEIVSIKWVEQDRDFNVGVKSPVDDKSMKGISSMRVHASFNYSNTNCSIRLTDIYILKFDDWYNATQAALATISSDITRIAEQIARSASMALVPFLDLLTASGSNKIGLRVELHQDNVCYEAGAKGSKLPPLYMNALDNHLIPTLHNESTGIENAIILELIFYIINV